MKKLIFILICLLSIVPHGTMAQTVTNKIQNTATVMLSNSTLYVGSKTILNGTKYPSGEILTIYGQDGVVRLVPLAIHNRASIYWTTNSILQVPTWSIGQDLPGAASHTWAIENSAQNTIPFIIVSNQLMGINIPLLAVSSNMFVTNNLTVLGTNNSKFYMVNGVRGMTLSVTNVGPGLGSSNVHVYAEGILTNKFTIP